MTETETADLNSALRVLAVIPARLASTRLPRKVLLPVAGQPLLAWVYEAAKICPELHDVVIAADSEEVAALCHDRDWPCIMTSPDLPSGTDRLHAVSMQMDADVYVNLQADEPLLLPSHITALLRPFADPAVSVTTLKVRCTPDNVNNPNAVKVVTTADNRALYFSRAPIPFPRDGSLHSEYWKHLGFYAYRRATLQHFATLAPGALEQIERLEQLRLLENGINIYVAATEYDTIGVDTKEDLNRVDTVLRNRR